MIRLTVSYPLDPSLQPVPIQKLSCFPQVQTWTVLSCLTHTIFVSCPATLALLSVSLSPIKRSLAVDRTTHSRIPPVRHKSQTSSSPLPLLLSSFNNRLHPPDPSPSYCQVQTCLSYFLPFQITSNHPVLLPVLFSALFHLSGCGISHSQSSSFAI